MRRGFKSAWILAGLAAIMALTVGGGAEARAGTRGITISGGFKPGTGDPPYIYFFDVLLDPGFEVRQFDLFTIFDLKGVTGASLSSQPPPSLPGFGWLPNPGQEQISWTFIGTTPIPNDHPVGSNIEVPLGQFSVQTSQSFASPPVPPGTKIPYTFTVFDLTTQKDISGSGI